MYIHIYIYKRVCVYWGNMCPNSFKSHLIKSKSKKLRLILIKTLRRGQRSRLRQGVLIKLSRMLCPQRTHTHTHTYISYAYMCVNIYLFSLPIGSLSWSTLKLSPAGRQRWHLPDMQLDSLHGSMTNSSHIASLPHSLSLSLPLALSHSLAFVPCPLLIGLCDGFCLQRHLDLFICNICRKLAAEGGAWHRV